MKICFTLYLNTLFEVTSHKLVAAGLRPAPHGLLPLTCLTFGNHAVVPFDLFIKRNIEALFISCVAVKRV